MTRSTPLPRPRRPRLVPALVAGAALTAGFSTAPALAQVPAHLQPAITETEAEGGFGTLGGFAYSPGEDAFYTVLYGSGLGIRRIEAGVSAENYVTPNPQQLFARSTDVLAGETDADDFSFTLPFDMMLNVAPVTIDFGSEVGGSDNTPVGSITYQPGELGYIIDAGSEVRDINGTGDTLYAATKRVYTYDLRPIVPGPTPDAGLPDLNTATNGLGTTIGAYDQVDWNDALRPLVSEADLQIAAGYTVGPDNETNFGRQAAWSSDGQSIYALDTGNETGGIFKISATTGDVVQMYRELETAVSGGNVKSEPTVIHSSVRDLGGGSGDQVFFDGTSENGNAGGISFIVDDGTPGLKTAQVALDGAEFSALINDTASLDALANDSQGNLYFYDRSTSGIFKYDTEGRVAAIANHAQIDVLNASQDGSYRNSGAIQKFEVYEDGGDTTLFYRSDNSYVARIDVPDMIADFNGDQVYDAADVAFFKQQFDREVNSSNEIAPGDSGYLDYLAADLNSSAVLSSSDGSLDEDAVDGFDLTTVRQFIDLRAGDTDWDFTVDADDFDTFKAGFNPTATQATFFEGNFDYAQDGDVDIADFAALKSNFGDTYDIDPLNNVAVASETVVEADPGTLVLSVGYYGDVYLVGDSVLFDSIQIVGSEESLLDENFIPVDGLGNPLTGDGYVADMTLGSGVNLTGSIFLGDLYSDYGVQDWTFTYNGSTLGTVVFNVPEPASALLLAGALGLMAGRRGVRR